MNNVLKIAPISDMEIFIASLTEYVYIYSKKQRSE